MSEIELLGGQIESIRSLLPLYFGFWFAGLVLCMASLIGDWQKKFGVTIGLSFFVAGSILLIIWNVDITPLIDERNELIDAEINLMICDELRVNILNIIEGKEFEPKHLGKNLDLKKDIYYYKCEVPLRDEVLKLQ